MHAMAGGGSGWQAATWQAARRPRLGRGPMSQNREGYGAVALAAASIFSMGGVIFGIASLYPVLHYERALEASSCGTPAMDDSGMTCLTRSQDQCCDAQLE